MKIFQLTIIVSASILGGCVTTPPASRPATLLPGDAAPSAASQTSTYHEGGNKHWPDQTPAAPASLSVDAAQTAVIACTDSASGVRVAAAVVDSAGVLHVAVAADGALPGRAFVAARKALVAVEFQEPTSEVRKQLASDPSLRKRIKPDMIVSPGAVPIVIEGKLVGAIGVSGGTPAQDERCANAGAAKILDKFK